MMNLYAGEKVSRYGFPDGHPFSPQRFDAFWEAFLKRDLDKNSQISIRKPIQATAAQIQLFHSKHYIEKVKQLSVVGEGYLDGGDTPAYPGVYEAAAYVVGSALQASNDIMQQVCDNAFVPIAGLHHAAPEYASGFCVFNDCGVVVNHLFEEFHLSRVAYVDIDAHHGDGVYYGFESDPRLIFADLHEDGRYLFPGTGREDECGIGEGKGYKLNIPMPKFSSDSEFFTQFERVIAFLESHKPEFIILQCGADSIKGDPLTHMCYSPDAHYHATVKLKEVAHTLGHNRLLCLGGGGYNLQNIAATWCEVVRALVDEK